MPAPLQIAGRSTDIGAQSGQTMAMALFAASSCPERHFRTKVRTPFGKAAATTGAVVERGVNLLAMQDPDERIVDARPLLT